MNWLLFTAGVLIGIILTLGAQAWLLVWLFSPIDRQERTSKAWWR